MLNLLIIIFLLTGLLVGYKRGFILQLIHLTSLFVSFAIAYAYYDKLAPKLVLWVPYPQFGDDSAFTMLFDAANLDEVFYRAIAFVLIFFGVKIALHIIGAMLDFVAYLPILKQFNKIAGTVLGFIEVYILIFIILYISALIPIEFIQKPLTNSFLAKEIITHTPIFSKQIFNLWF